MIGKPVEYPGARDFYCPYRIVGLGDERVRRAGGIDAVQALVLAFKMIAADLAASVEGQRGVLRWEGDETGDLGLPFLG